MTQNTPYGAHIRVLDHGSITLLDSMPGPESPLTLDQAVVQAARVSYRGEMASEPTTWGLKGDTADRKLLFYLMEHHHTSPFEHVSLKFHVSIPIVVERQWLRHRTGSYNGESGRYQEYQETDHFYIPDPRQWRLQSRVNKQGSEGTLYERTPGRGAYYSDKMIDMITQGYSLYTRALEDGVSREQARLFLPAFSLYVSYVITFDLHNLLHFCGLRQDSHAQYEIRMYANAVWGILTQVAPWTCEAFEQFQRGWYSK